MSHVFLEADQCPKVSLAAMLAEVTFELRQRDHVYPRLIAQGRLTRQMAEHHYGAMVGVLRFLETWGQMELFTREPTTPEQKGSHDATQGEKEL